MTLATGSRGAAARDDLRRDRRDVQRQAVAVRRRRRARSRSLTAYSSQVAAYRARFPDMAPLVRRRSSRATDTFVARLDADLLRPRPALRHLHPRLQRPGAVPRVDRPGRDRDVRRSRRAASELGLRRDRGARSTTRPSCGARGRPPRGAARRSATSSPPNSKVPLHRLEQPLRLTPGPSHRARRRRENLRPTGCPAPRRGSASRPACPAFVYGGDFTRPAAGRRPLLGHREATTCAASTRWAPTS